MTRTKKAKDTEENKELITKELVFNYAKKMNIKLKNVYPSDTTLKKLAKYAKHINMCNDYIDLDTLHERAGYKAKNVTLWVAEYQEKEEEEYKTIGFIMFAQNYSKIVHDLDKTGFNIDDEVFKTKKRNVTEILDVCSLSQNKGGRRGTGTLLMMMAFAEGRNNYILWVARIQRNIKISFTLDKKVAKKTKQKKIWTPAKRTLLFYKNLGFQPVRAFETKSKKNEKIYEYTNEKGDNEFYQILRLKKGKPTKEWTKRILNHFVPERYREITQQQQIIIRSRNRKSREQQTTRSRNRKSREQQTSRSRNRKSRKEKNKRSRNRKSREEENKPYCGSKRPPPNNRNIASPGYCFNLGKKIGCGAAMNNLHKSTSRRSR